MAKRPRNYAATESTLIQNRKTRKDIAALTKRVAKLETSLDQAKRLIAASDKKVEQVGATLDTLRQRI